MDGVKDALLREFAVHYDLIFVIAHFIELLVSELALAARSHQSIDRLRRKQVRLFAILFVLLVHHANFIIIHHLYDFLLGIVLVLRLHLLICLLRELLLDLVVRRQGLPQRCQVAAASLVLEELGVAAFFGVLMPALVQHLVEAGLLLQHLVLALLVGVFGVCPLILKVLCLLGVGHLVCRMGAQDAALGDALCLVHV